VGAPSDAHYDFSLARRVRPRAANRKNRRRAPPTKPVHIGFGQDRGQASKSQAFHLARGLDGFTVAHAAPDLQLSARHCELEREVRVG